MSEEYVLCCSSETQEKLRWDVKVDKRGRKFELYVPKWRVPQPWPGRIHVLIFTLDPDSNWILPLDRNPSSDIVAVVRKYSEMVHSVRFSPIGKPELWEIGEPYIPYSLLPHEDVTQLIIKVKWDHGSPWTAPAYHIASWFSPQLA